MFPLLEKHKQVTSSGGSPNIDGKQLPDETIIRKSIPDNLFSAALGLMSMVIMIYAICTSERSVIIWPILMGLFFLVFFIYSLIAVLDRRAQLKIDKTGIAFSDGSVINWMDVETTYIEIRAIRSRPRVDRYYLVIQKKTPAGLSRELAPKIFQITGLEYAPKEIAHIVEVYKDRAAHTSG